MRKKELISVEEKEEKRKVIVSNSILNACYNLSVAEKRILFIAMEKIDIWGEYQDGICIVSAEEYAELTDTTVEAAYVTLKDSSKQLFDRYIRVKGLASKRSETWFRWLTSVAMIPETRNLGLRWNVELREFLSEIKRDYTKLHLQQTMLIDSMYAGRLYDFIYQHRFKGDFGLVETNIDEIRERWVIPESCREYKYLKSKILLPAIEELKKKELVWVELEEPRKRNVYIVHFRYRFFKKEDWISLRDIKNFTLRNI